MRGPGQEQSAFLALLPAVLVTLIALTGGAVAAFAPPAKGEMALIFAPGTSQAAALAAIIGADGRFVGPSRFDNVVIAVALDDGFFNRVRAEGAWLAVKAQGLCSPAPKSRDVI